ncbi:hypothetical protein [Dactylosporangium salmoneum]|uniref:Secreted protein n=1 Tax=Dactylosporangium salmoneum TaxID=53361 RepID=A0ABP5SV42_9ACTN
MTTALIAAIAGVAGVIFGRWWDIRSESARWRRDRRVQSYEDVAAEHYRLREALRLLAVREPDADVAALRSGVEAAYADWNRILSALWLHGSDAVAISAVRVDHEFNLLLREARRTAMDQAAWPRAREPLYERYDDFIDAVRAELSLPRLTALRAGAATRQLLAPEDGPEPAPDPD